MHPVPVAHSALDAGQGLGFEVETPLSVFVDKLKNLTVPSTVAEVHALFLACPSVWCSARSDAYLCGPGRSLGSTEKALACCGDVGLHFLLCRESAGLAISSTACVGQEVRSYVAAAMFVWLVSVQAEQEVKGLFSGFCTPSSFDESEMVRS